MIRALAIVAALGLAGCQAEPPEPPPPPLPPLPAAPQSAVDAPPATPEAPAAPQTVGKQAACGPGEQTVFSCRAENGKRIAVCAAKGQAMEYRYGKDTSEISLPATEFAQTMYSGGNEVQVGFDNGDTRYVVFSRMIRTNFKADEPNNPAISDGVIVLKSGRFQTIQLCSASEKNSGLDLNALDAALPRQEELLTYETGRADR